MTHLTLAIGIAANTLFAPPQPIQVQFAKSLVGRQVTVCIDGRQTKATFAGKLGFRGQNRSWQSLCADVRTPMVDGLVFRVLPGSSAKFGGRVQLAGNIVAKYFHQAKTRGGDALHLVHGDVNPSNVFFSAGGEVKRYIAPDPLNTDRLPVKHHEASAQFQGHSIAVF